MSHGSLAVTALHTYPIKSCAGIALVTSRLTPRGLEHDRDYMLVGDDGSFLSQRQIPEMALIMPTIGDTAITLRAPGMDPVDVPLEIAPDLRQRVEATVHGDPITGQHLSPAIDEWFTTFLPGYGKNRGYRLLRVCEDAPRLISIDDQQVTASNQVGFADGHAILLTTEPSLAALNREMDDPVAMDRFRPNVVVDGPDLSAYEEDFWTDLRIGALNAFVIKGCTRCAIPDVDQASGKVGKNVRRALTGRRGVNSRDPSHTGVFFGQNLTHVPSPGVTISIGDPITVMSRSGSPNVVLRTAARAA